MSAEPLYIQKSEIRKIVNGLSVDVEDWFQVGAFEKVISRDDWDDIKTRVENNVDQILDMFAEADVKATFFTLGWVARRHPKMMQRIADQGHEVASHGYDHARVFTFDREGFAQDIKLAREILQDAAGVEITGYRAPSFSIDHRTPWAFEALAEHGYAYSSSVAPVVHDHYGWPEAPRFAFRPLGHSDLIEIPVTTAEFANKRLAAGGGGFFRVLPYAFFALGHPAGQSAPRTTSSFLLSPVGDRPGSTTGGSCSAALAFPPLYEPQANGSEASSADARI